MVVLKNVLLGACVVAALSINAYADEVDCSAECPVGQRSISFGDGSNVRCACVGPSAMDETVDDVEDDGSVTPYD